MILDQASLLSRYPDTVRELSAKLLQLRQDTGFSLFLVIQSGLSTASPNDTADRFQLEWLPEGNGLVTVFETDSRQCGFGKPYFNNSDSQDLIPSFEFVECITRSLKALDLNKPDSEMVVSLTEKLAVEFRKLLTTDPQPVPAGRALRLLLFLVGAGALLALGTLLVGWFARRDDRSRNEQFVFTEVDRPERLGAPFGGGLASIRKFR